MNSLKKEVKEKFLYSTHRCFCVHCNIPINLNKLYLEDKLTPSDYSTEYEWIVSFNCPDCDWHQRRVAHIKE
jgi:RNase P subunit RPR2